jgi:hypothetical protein
VTATTAGLLLGVAVSQAAGETPEDHGHDEVRCDASEYRISSHALIDFQEPPDYVDATPRQALSRLFDEYSHLDSKEIDQHVATAESSVFELSREQVLDLDISIVPDVVFEGISNQPAEIAIELRAKEGLPSAASATLVRTRSGWTVESFTACESLLFGTKSAYLADLDNGEGK